MLVIDLIEHFKLKEGFLELIMDLLFFLDEKSYVELLDMSRTDIIRAVEMRRYLTREDRMFMCDVINELSVRELFEVRHFIFIVLCHNSICSVIYSVPSSTYSPFLDLLSS